MTSTLLTSTSSVIQIQRKILDNLLIQIYIESLKLINNNIYTRSVFSLIIVIIKILKYLSGSIKASYIMYVTPTRL